MLSLTGAGGVAPELLNKAWSESYMKLREAKQLIDFCAAQMNARYSDIVFDEWAIVNIEGQKGRLLAYTGPRKQQFQDNFLSDAGGLRAGLLTQQHQTGDFEFVRDNVGTGFESFMVVGPATYLICNNTVQSMDAIARNPRWLGAQVPFVELSDRFRDDPVSLHNIERVPAQSV